MEDCKTVFTDIYQRKVWGDGSGGGSAPDIARPYTDFIASILVHESDTPRKTVLDIGCGYGKMCETVSVRGWHYIGVDAANIKETSGRMLSGRPIDYFVRGNFDALTDPLPLADLVLCKEVLQHLSNTQVQLLLDRTAHYKRRLFTSMTGEGTNTDIPCGGSRPVDLSKAPFYQNCRTVLTYGTNATWIVQELTNP